MRLIGLVVVRNHRTLDYCPIEAALSLKPFCDSVVVSDGESDDGSYEELQLRFAQDDKVVVETQPWPKGENNPHWWVEALNYAREKFVGPNEMLLQLDADEVIGPESALGIKMAMENPHGGANFKRYTFWGDPWHMVPYNRCCGEKVARMGPGRLYLPSDEPHPLRHTNIRDVAEDYPNLFIYHYGMIRESEAFLRKSEVVQRKFFGSCDQRLLSAKGKSEPWHKSCDFFDGEPLREFHGNHPQVIWQWLRDRGHKL